MEEIQKPKHYTQEKYEKYKDVIKKANKKWKDKNYEKYKDEFNAKRRERINCNKCGKNLSKGSLWNHLRTPAGCIPPADIKKN